MEKFSEEDEDIGNDRPRTDYEIQRAQWKNLGSWKEVRFEERLACAQLAIDLMILMELS